MLPVLLQDMRYLTWQQAFADSILIHIIHVHFSRGFYGIYIDNIPSVAVTAYSVEYNFFYRRWIPTTAGAAVLVMLEMCQFPCFVSTLWMIPFAHGRLYLGMNAGEFFF